MQLVELNDIKNILIKHNYTVRVECSAENCTILLPKRVLEPAQEAKTVIMSMLDNGVAIADGENNQIISCPSYVHRVLIYCGIVRECRKIHYKHQAVDCFNEKNERVETIFNVLMTKNKEDKTRESVVAALVHQASDEHDEAIQLLEIAQKYKVEEGFNSVYNFLYPHQEGESNESLYV